jgi:hypothetical protein
MNYFYSIDQKLRVKHQHSNLTAVIAMLPEHFFFFAGSAERFGRPISLRKGEFVT